jgi:hypothetical protein
VFRHPFLPQLREALPYAILRVAIDELDDAVLHGRLNADPEQIAIGDHVVVSWDDGGDGFVLPNWTKAL